MYHILFDNEEARLKNLFFVYAGALRAISIAG
jgi:hypothetical protein